LVTVVVRSALANQRFGRLGRLQTRFTLFAVTPLKVARDPAALLLRHELELGAVRR
jgi:hypothetical protein